MNLAALYDFLGDLTAEIVIILGVLVIRRLRGRKTTRAQESSGKTQSLDLK